MNTMFPIKQKKYLENTVFFSSKNLGLNCETECDASRKRVCGDLGAGWTSVVTESDTVWKVLGSSTPRVI